MKLSQLNEGIRDSKLNVGAVEKQFAGPTPQSDNQSSTGSVGLHPHHEEAIRVFNHLLDIANKYNSQGKLSTHGAAWGLADEIKHAVNSSLMSPASPIKHNRVSCYPCSGMGHKMTFPKDTCEHCGGDGYTIKPS